MRRVAFAAALILSFSAATASAITPACVRENGCTVPACFGAIGGTIHYVCDCATTGKAGAQPGGQQPDAGCVAGNDSNAGTLKSAPWKTYGKAEAGFGSMAAGDAVLFCNGGVFDLTGTASTRWVNRNSSAGSRVVVGPYGGASWQSGTEHRPKWLNPSATYAVNLDDGSDIARGGYVFYGISIEGIGRPASPTGTFEAFFVYNQVSNIYICDMEIAYLGIGIENGGGNGTNDDNQNIQLQYSYVHDNGNQGALGSQTNALFDSSLWVNNGFMTANLDHHIYLSSGGSAGITVTNNEFYKGAQVGGNCSGVEIVMHGIVAGALIAGNWIHEDAGNAGAGCYGVGINPGYTSHEEFNNVVIKGNVFQNVGGSGTNVSACHDCDVDSNIYIAAPTSGFEAITLDDDGQGGGGVTDQDNLRVRARNNTAYGAIGSLVRVSNAGTVYTISNNALQHTGTTGTINPFTNALADASFLYVDKNWAVAAGATIVWNASGAQTRANYCTNHGFDCNSTQGTATNFTNARLSTSFAGAGADFTPAGGSGLISAGNFANRAPTDWFGATRPNPPAIGAVDVLQAFTAGKGSLGMFGGF